MKPDNNQLMAYVDGTLPAHVRDEVEREISASPEMRDSIALFKASQLPYAEAFASQKLPPVPSSLTANIEEMARAAHANAGSPPSSSGGASANDAHTEHAAGSAVVSTIRSRLRVAPAWLGVAFLAGAFACGLVLRLGNGAGPASSVGASVASVGTGVSPWIAAAASYQQLYSRETLASVDADPALSERTAAQIHDDGLAVKIPDLRSSGLTFKRVQRLRFNNKPLVQIVYLPESGAPVALCIMKESKPDAGVANAQVAAMNVVTWRQADLGYALIAQPGGTDLTALGKQISTGQAASLYGLLDESGGLYKSSRSLLLASLD